QKEYALLEYLMRHAGIPVTREQISEQVWKQPFDPTTNIVDVYINYLRKKLESDGASPLVHTVRGVGYVLRESETGDSYARKWLPPPIGRIRRGHEPLGHVSPRHRVDV